MLNNKKKLLSKKKIVEYKERAEILLFSYCVGVSLVPTRVIQPNYQQIFKIKKLSIRDKNYSMAKMFPKFIDERGLK